MLKIHPKNTIKSVSVQVLLLKLLAFVLHFSAHEKSKRSRKNVSFHFLLVFLPGKVDSDICDPPADLGEGERSDIAPDLHRLPDHTAHLLLVHLPGEALDPAGEQRRR